MAGQRIHIVPHEQGWAMKREGQTSVESVHATQKEAIDAGRDTAKEEEVDLVVHRADGTFRNVLSFTSEPMNNGNGKKVEVHDVMSVGSRVSWSAILIGACVALAINAVLWMGGVALGMTVHDRLGPRALSIAGAVWVFVSTLFALFCGGFVVSRLTAGEDKTEAAMYGVALWGVMFALTMLLAASGAATGAQLATMRPVTEQPLLSADNYREAGLTREQIDKLETLDRQARDAANRIDPAEAAWWSFAGMVLSMGAAVLGSIVGSGPTFTLRFGGTRPTTAQIQPT